MPRLAPAACDYAARYHVNPDDILLFQVEHGLVFDRAFWRTLVGELLLFAARDIPEFPTTFDTLTRLVAPDSSSASWVSREQRPAIHQALRGSRDLVFGTAVYRPEHAGCNNAADVVRLAEYLASIRSDAWAPADLAAFPDLHEEEDRLDELAFAKEWLGVLTDLYRRAAAAGQVLVIESIF